MKIKHILPILIPVSSLLGCNPSSASNFKTVTLYYTDNIVRKESVKVGEEYTAPSFAKTEISDFYGWYYNPAFSSVMRASFPIVIEDDVTLYASWGIKYFTIIYDFTDHGYYSESLVTKVYYGQKATYFEPKGEIDEEQHIQYVFDGWYSDKECQNKFNFNSRILENTHLYVKWKTEHI